MDDSFSFTIASRGDVPSVTGYLQMVFELRGEAATTDTLKRKLWYRGHANAGYQLIPSVGRPLVYAWRKLKLRRKEEIQLLHRFRRRAYPYVGRALTAGEAIFLARHHSLPTRLLDWTANALYALYFACCEQQGRDATVWAMARRAGSKDLDPFVLAEIKDEADLFAYRLPAKEPAGDHPSDKCALKIVHPFYNSPRLLAQDGAFTLHSDPWCSIESLAETPFTKYNLDIEKLFRFRVAAEQKVPILKDLSGLGITQRSVFPDLDGVARSLWETETLWTSLAKPEDAP